MMFAFVMTVLIVLPPINAVQRAHPIHSFTIQSTPAYASLDACARAGQATGEYIERRLPNGAVANIEYDCQISEVQEL